MSNQANEQRIQPYVENRFYWQYQGQPVLLLGGSVEDNLFQIPDLLEQLDLLQSVGGNYVRCTMSSRDEGDVWPFERDEATGLYDLNTPGQEYWDRFRQFLDLTAERDIFAQFELWDRFDFAREPWQDNPYNPKNNVNYTAEESGLVEQIDTHPGLKENAFFRTPPELENNEVVLPFQQAQIRQMLSISLQYGHVLYCMDNETNESPLWPAYWAEFVRDEAEAAGVGVEMTEMWDAHDLQHPQHANTFDHPERYSFVDISQNNHSPANRHWDNAQLMRQKIIDSGNIRPMNTVKIYGANTGPFGNTRDGQERFWRNIFGGLATTRFHRPPAGLGLGDIAQSHIRSMRMITDEMCIFRCEPHNDLLDRRGWNEAYCTAEPGKQYAVFFPDGGNVFLDVSAGKGTWTVRWLDIRSSTWQDPQQMDADERLTLATPQEEGYWAVLVTPAD